MSISSRFLPILPQDDLQWPELRDSIAPFLGERVVTLLAYAISEQNGCEACTASFGKMLLEAGDDPDHPQVTETEQLLIDWGRLIARSPRDIPDAFYTRLEAAFGAERRIAILSFAAQIVAMNLVNTVGRVSSTDAAIAGQPRRSAMSL